MNADPQREPTDQTADGMPAFLAGGGELGELIRHFDWSGTCIGPLEQWPQSLKTVTSMLLRSPVPIVLLWGEPGIMIYNDAYSMFAGGRHPQLLGSEVRLGWPEVADFNDHVMKVGLAGGTLAYKDQVLTLHRPGRPVQVYANLDYSPVLDESGKPAGVIAIVVETTERTLAEARVRNSEERFRALVTTTADVVYRMDPAWTEMRALDGKGFILDTLAPRRDWIDEYIHPDDQPRVREAIQDAIDHKATFELEHRVRRVDGSLGWTASRAVPLFDEAGEIVEWFGAASDVTSRRAAEDTARESEARLRFLDGLTKETTPISDADVLLATTARLLGQHLNVALCAYADVDADGDSFTIRGDWAAPGMPSLVGHYQLSAFGDLTYRKLRAGQPLILCDNRIELPPDDAARFQHFGLLATVCMPLVKAGRLTALMAVHDRVARQWTASELMLLGEVTERSWAHIERIRSEVEVRRGEQRFREELEAKVVERTAALERSEANIRTIFDTSHLYQGLLALDGTVLYANATALAGIAARLQDVAGQPFWDTPWFADTPGMPETVREAVSRVAAGATENMSMALNLHVGVRSFDFSLRPVRNEVGEVVAMVPELVDKTARLKAELALQQVQKMEALGNLTGGIAHDFNNLLMAVMGSLELLRKRMPDEPALLRLVDNARAGAERGAALTTRMLAFARRQELRTERIDVKRLVSEMTELLQRSLGTMIAVETQFSSPLSMVVTDPNQLESALLNLAVNARDAMRGEGRIVIAARDEVVMTIDSVLTAGRYVCLAVSDIGEGMDEATLKRATEPFFTTKGVGKGTGLGLSMVHGFAEQSGGTLMLHSTPGVGTTAEIWLPAVDAQAPYTGGTAPASGARVAANDRMVITILAVDDDPLVLTNTAELLEDLGHRVYTARSGREALEALEARRIDLVITDHAMPQMTGMQLAVEVRARYPGMPIVLATGYAELPAGTTADLPKLSKPFSQAQLAEMVTMALNARHS